MHRKGQLSESALRLVFWVFVLAVLMIVVFMIVSGGISIVDVLPF